jgi:hypothetical protein
VALLFCPSLSAVGVALDLTWFRRVRHAETWWFVLRHHQDPSQDGALVVGGDMDPDLLELATIWRRGSPRGTRSSTLLVDLLPQPATAEGVSRAVVIGALYVERIAAARKARS